MSVKVDEHTDQLVEQSRSPHEIMPKTISFNKESQAKEQFVRKVEAGEGTVVDKTLHKYVVLYVEWFFLRWSTPTLSTFGMQIKNQPLINKLSAFFNFSSTLSTDKLFSRGEFSFIFSCQINADLIYWI